jgi:hypothetical protein
MHFAERTTRARAVLQLVDKLNIGKIHKREGQLWPQITQ